MYFEFPKGYLTRFYYTTLRGCNFKNLNITSGYLLQEQILRKDTKSSYSFRWVDFVLEGEYRNGYLKIYLTLPNGIKEDHSRSGRFVYTRFEIDTLIFKKDTDEPRLFEKN